MRFMPAADVVNIVMGNTDQRTSKVFIMLISLDDAMDLHHALAPLIARYDASKTAIEVYDEMTRAIDQANALG